MDTTANNTPSRDNHEDRLIEFLTLSANYLGLDNTSPALRRALEQTRAHTAAQALQYNGCTVTTLSDAAPP